MLKNVVQKIYLVTIMQGSEKPKTIKKLIKKITFG